MGEKRIEVCKMRVGDLKHNFGNPRISKKKLEHLENYINMFGYYGPILIDEQDNVIIGNHAVSILTKENADVVADVTRLLGYSIEELRSINQADRANDGAFDMGFVTYTHNGQMQILSTIPKRGKKRKNPEKRVKSEEE